MRCQAVILLMVAVALGGCAQATVVFEEKDTGVDAGADTGDACPGQCLPLAPADWTPYPVLLWIGDPDKVPNHCPSSAPSHFYQGHESLDITSNCDVCTCGAPVCVLPSGLTASDSPMCQGPMFTPFDAPASWDGSCIAPSPIAPGLAGSVQLAAPTVSACMPGAHPVPTKLPPPTWGAYGYACNGVTYGRCEDPGMFCVPAPEPSPAPEFQECIEYTRDDLENASCPDVYPVRHVFYQDYEDTRYCTPCACEPPASSNCTAMVSVYEDASCAKPLDSVLVTQASLMCADTAPGKGIKSMSATMIDDEPGQCAPSGGVLMGAVTQTFAHVFCCRAH